VVGVTGEPFSHLLAVEVAPEVGAYFGVGGALLLLFRVVFRTMSRTDTETVRQFAQLRQELAYERAWRQYERGRADHFMARALNDPQPPPLPAMPSTEHDLSDPPAPLAPPT
jgi:hypothetical protein